MSERIYGLLLLAYPRAFRQAWREEMQRFFRDCLRAARRRGRFALLRLWLDTLADLALTAPGQRFDALFHGIEAAREATLRTGLVLLLTAAITSVANYVMWSLASGLVSFAPARTVAPTPTALFYLLAAVAVGVVAGCVVFACLNFRALAARRARFPE